MYRGGFQSREQTGAIRLALIQPSQRSKKVMLDLFEVRLIASHAEWTILWYTCHGRMLWHTARGRARGCHGRLSGSMLLGAACTTGMRMRVITELHDTERIFVPTFREFPHGNSLTPKGKHMMNIWQVRCMCCVMSPIRSSSSLLTRTLCCRAPSRTITPSRTDTQARAPCLPSPQTSLDCTTWWATCGSG